MYLKSLELIGFKSFARKTKFEFKSSITAIVGPNGSGKSNVAEAFRFVLGEQSMKSMRGKRTEDLIFNGSRTTPRSSRAGVKLAFDNTKKLLDLDFDEAILERVIHRDSSSEYAINGSRVRLKDIYELLAGARIGASGHHIISQGEADRVLNVNTKDRKVMIEDALGLKIYQYKKTESERKLIKTEENIEKVQGLRREISPHLKFLQKQVNKIEKTREQAKLLVDTYKDYFVREKYFIKKEHEDIDALRKPLALERDMVSKELAGEREKLSKIENSDPKTATLINLEGDLREARDKKNELVRNVGRIEGEVSAETRRLEKGRHGVDAGEDRTVLLSDVKALSAEIDSYISEGNGVDSLSGLRDVLGKIGSLVRGFVLDIKNTGGNNEDVLKKDERDLEVLKANLRVLEDKLAEASREEQKIHEAYQTVKRNIEVEHDSSREAERAVFELTSRQNELHLKLSEISGREERLHLIEEEYKRELGEAAALVGREAVNYEQVVVHNLDEPRDKQEARKREVEKMKIRIEDAGIGGNEDITKEFDEVRERDAFLEREIEDLEKTAGSLKELINELTEKLGTEFGLGIDKINKEFNSFFSLMFGGGEASISVVKEKVSTRKDTDISTMLGDDDYVNDDVSGGYVEGVAIHVSLPHKKIRGLEMLSGGERALTSIALIFAMSQVNPPPFLILDETDAALDEANSKRYGDMIENLSKRSQLILISHNRETMSRAGILYGITMGADGISQVLSVDFEEATRVAK
jgi:chromosome segregation protein